MPEYGRHISFIILGIIAFTGIAYVGILPSLSFGDFSINDMTHDVYHALDIDHCFQVDENENWYIETDPT